MNSETRQALAELLLLAPYVDCHLSSMEDEVLETAMVSIGWSPRNPEDLCLSTAFTLVREAGTSEIKKDEFMRRRTAMVKDAGESALAFQWLGRILGSDGMTGDEHSFLTKVRSQLF